LAGAFPEGLAKSGRQGGNAVLLLLTRVYFSRSALDDRFRSPITLD